MLFTCPANVARGGARGKSEHRHRCVDVHCHVHFLPADEVVKGIHRPEIEPNARFSSEISRATNRKQMENVRVCLTSVEQRLRDMDKMGVEIQAISVSPFQFMYALQIEHGGRVEIHAEHRRRSDGGCCGGWRWTAAAWGGAWPSSE